MRLLKGIVPTHGDNKTHHLHCLVCVRCIHALIGWRSRFKTSKLSVCVIAMKRPNDVKIDAYSSTRSSDCKRRSSNLSADERENVRAELVATSTGPKSSIANVLHKLQERGLLNDTLLGEPNEARRLTDAAAAHAKAVTPYGTVVQTIPLTMTHGPDYAWEVVNPFAFIWYLASMCAGFATLITSSVVGATPLAMVLYGDELTPSNPLRADKGRQAFCFYYSFLEFPTWVLQRKDAWLSFGSLRTSILEKVKGSVSTCMALSMRVFFTDGTANFTTGFLVGSRMVRAVFKGFLADEKALKEFWDIKGQAGTKPCMACQNLFNFIHKVKRRDDGPYTIGVDCTDRSKSIPHDDESIRKLHDDLVARADANVAAGQAELSSDDTKFQTQVGVNLNRTGLLGSQALRGVVKPVSNYIRDWQHTLVSGGVAGTALACTLSSIATNPRLGGAIIGLNTLQEYAGHWVLQREP